MAAAPPIIVTEDTPPDMLAGSMDLMVVLPNGQSLKMSVERSTPMMDLLVQITTANKISPAGYIIKPLNEQGPLPYKPSTPIGALDAWTIHVVPKHFVQCSSNKKFIKSYNQPFEQTFRLQVHLPRNQLYVARVSPKTKLADIFQQVCAEKNLDPLKYSLRHPNNLDQVLRLQRTLADYKLQEVTVVCSQSHPVEVSTVDIMSLRRDAPNPAYRNTLCEGSVSSGSLEGRSLSPAPSDESSASPPPLPPSRPTRKRRPAPKPPITIQKPLTEDKQLNGISSTTVINHSRNSSDSSGYHEASVLSESPHSNNVTEALSKQKMTSVSEVVALSQSMSDVTMIESTMKQAISSTSISSLSSNPGRKKKAAPPPPSATNNRPSSETEDQQKTSSLSSTASSSTTLDSYQMNLTVKSATLPASSRLNTITTTPPPSPSPSPITTRVDVEPQLTTQESDEMNLEIRMADEEIDRIFSNATKNHTSHKSQVEEHKVMELPSPPVSLTNVEMKQASQGDEVSDWEYKLPAPPTFRDEAKSPSLTEFGTVTVANLSDIACSKQDNSNKTDLEKIIESEIRIKDKSGEEDHFKAFQADLNGMSNKNSSGKTGEVENRQCNTTSFEYENVATKSQVREITTAECSNMAITNINNPTKPEVSKVESKQVSRDVSTTSTLQNFMITTYKDTKPVEVFEDESIKSSAGEKRDKSKDDAVFRAPKARVKEPNLSRTSSFSVENKVNGPLIKRSVSYVSLLAANMPRNSQPYKEHLSRQHSSAELDSHNPWPRLRKTTSELNIDDQDGKLKDTPLWNEELSQLQSVKVLRNILSQSHANLSSTQDENKDLLENEHSDPLSSDQRFEHTSSKRINKTWGKSQSEEKSNKWISNSKIQHSQSLDQEYPKLSSTLPRGLPSVNFSTWSERPKRQISIKNDNDCISGFGKKIITHDETLTDTKNAKNSAFPSLLTSVINNFQAEENKKSESFKIEGRSKSISDLSRIPIVRAVELKKPFSMANFDHHSSKPLQPFDNAFKNNNVSVEASKLDDLNNNEDENLITVNSLAKKFGRPLSIHMNNSMKKVKIDTSENDCQTLKSSFSKVIKLKESSDLYGKFSQDKNTMLDSTLKVKALAKTRSGGFTDNSTSDSATQSEPHITERNFDSSNNLSPEVEKKQVLSVSSTNNSGVQSSKNIQETSNSSSSISSNKRGVSTSNIYIRQMSERQVRPLALQPVVKGFRVESLSQSSLQNVPLSPITKDSNIIPLSNLSNKVLKPDSSAQRKHFNRTLSAPANQLSSTAAHTEFAKDKCSTETFPAVAKNKLAQVNVIPPLPPQMPVLRPVSERKNIKLLPPPEALPRDQLMLSIRSFSIDNLKRVSK